MRDRIRKRTKYLTVSAMLCALSVIILSLGSLIEVLDITTAVLASLLCIYAVIEMGGAYPWLIWPVTSILALLLLPQKTPALFYALFAGFYPILKEKLEKLKVNLCMECGCCNYVCPANRQLVQANKLAKAMLRSYQTAKKEEQAKKEAAAK